MAKPQLQWLLQLLSLAVFIWNPCWCLQLREEDEKSVIELAASKSLRFSTESKFRIAVFADLHYGEAAWTDWGAKQDENSDRVISSVLDHEQPDFVIYLGDVITANNLPIPNASLYWDQATSLAKQRGIPWATVFGNHDDAPFEWPEEWFSSSGIPQIICPIKNSSVSGQACSFRGTHRLELMKTETETNQLSFSNGGPPDLWPSVSNYMLPVFSSKDPSSPVVFLYFLDSGGGSYPEVISRAQANWFKALSEEINLDFRIPEVIFWHIPSIAYKKVAPRRIFKIQKPCVGSINKEKVAAQEAEWGIIDILLERPSVKAVFVGHNHGLDWCCPYKTIWLCFARHSGYGGYGNWPRGARMIEMQEEPFTMRSWIRMEDGSEHSNVMLSS